MVSGWSLDEFDGKMIINHETSFRQNHIHILMGGRCCRVFETNSIFKWNRNKLGAWLRINVFGTSKSEGFVLPMKLSILGFPPKDRTNAGIASWCEVGTIVGICGFLTPLVAGWDVAITPDMLFCIGISDINAESLAYYGFPICLTALNVRRIHVWPKFGWTIMVPNKFSPEKNTFNSAEFHFLMETHVFLGQNSLSDARCALARLLATAWLEQGNWKLITSPICMEYSSWWRWWESDGKMRGKWGKNYCIFWSFPSFFLGHIKTSILLFFWCWFR